MERRKKITKIILITITLLFLLLMLAAPLLSVLVNSLKEGIGFYVQAISTPYVVSALLVTLLATVIAVVVNTFFGICAAWLLTKFSFRGKQIYTIFHFSGYCRSFLFDDIWKTGMVLSGDSGV